MVKVYRRQVILWKKTRNENSPRKRVVPLTSSELKYLKRSGNVEPFEKRILTRQKKLMKASGQY